MNLLTKNLFKKNKASRRDHWISMIEPYYYYYSMRENQDNSKKKTNIFWQKKKFKTKNEIFNAY